MKLKLIISMALLSLFASCGDTTAPLEEEVGSSVTVAIPYLSFNPESTYIEKGIMTVEGTVLNMGTTQIDPTWYVEAQFFSDSTFSVKLGGNLDTLLLPLKPGEQALWKVRFTSTAVDPNKYANFRVSNIRGVRK